MRFSGRVVAAAALTATTAFAQETKVLNPVVRNLSVSYVNEAGKVIFGAAETAKQTSKVTPLGLILTLPTTFSGDQPDAFVIRAREEKRQAIQISKQALIRDFLTFERLVTEDPANIDDSRFTTERRIAEQMVEICRGWWVRRAKSVECDHNTFPRIDLVEPAVILRAAIRELNTWHFDKLLPELREEAETSPQIREKWKTDPLPLVVPPFIPSDASAEEESEIWMHWQMEQTTHTAKEKTTRVPLQTVSTSNAASNSDLPIGSAYQVVRMDTIREKVFYVAEPTSGEADKLSELWNLQKIVEIYPEFGRMLEIRVLPDGSLRYLDYQGFNNIFLELQKNKDAFHFLFYPNAKGFLEASDFLERYANGEIPFSVIGSEHFHDVGAHFIYFMFPQPLVDLTMNIAKTMVRLAKDPVLRSNPLFLRLIQEAIQAYTLTLDLTGVFSDQLVKTGDRAKLLEWMQQTLGTLIEPIFNDSRDVLPTKIRFRNGHDLCDKLLGRDFSKELGLTPEQKQAIREIREETPRTKKLSQRDFRKILDQMLELLGPRLPAKN